VIRPESNRYAGMSAGAPTDWGTDLSAPRGGRVIRSFSSTLEPRAERTQAWVST